MNLELNRPCPPDKQTSRLARLTRHLEARLLDFGPGGPQVTQCNPQAGFAAARFPGHNTAQVVDQLAQRGFCAALEGDCAGFYLSPDLRFEDLDRLWGCLYEIL